MRRELILCWAIAASTIACRPAGTPWDGLAADQPDEQRGDARAPLLRTIWGLVNQTRAQGRTCGDDGEFAPVPPLVWEERLADAAQSHADDMAENDYFAHEARDGSDPGDRVKAHGYPWSSVGENIAARQRTPQRVVVDWIESPGHCSNLMSPAFTQMGAGVSNGGRWGRYWSLTLARPRR